MALVLAQGARPDPPLGLQPLPQVDRDAQTMNLRDLGVLPRQQVAKVRRTGLLRNVMLVGYPVLMGFAVVYTGEHYVIDVIVGAAYAVLVVAAARLIPAEPLEAASARVSTTVGRGRGRKYRRRCA